MLPGFEPWSRPRAGSGYGPGTRPARTARVLTRHVGAVVWDVRRGLRGVHVTACRGQRSPMHPAAIPYEYSQRARAMGLAWALSPNRCKQSTQLTKGGSKRRNQKEATLYSTKNPEQKSRTTGHFSFKHRLLLLNRCFPFSTSRRDVPPLKKLALSTLAHRVLPGRACRVALPAKHCPESVLRLFYGFIGSCERDE